MYSVWAGIGISVAVLGVWLALLSYYLWKQKKFLDELVPVGETKKSAGDSLEKRFAAFKVVLEELDRRDQILSKNFKDLAKQGLDKVERVEMVRYNPYKDTGGDQSFSLVLLDGKQSGIILTSLHSRAGTRAYVRKINRGSSDMELTREEKEILKKAVEK